MVLMLLSAVPIGIGVLIAFVRTLVSEPSALLALRALLFFTAVAGVVVVLVYGVIGLWKQKKYGYWIGLLFLATINVKNMYVLGPTVYKLLLIHHLESSNEFAVMELVLQGVLFLLLLLLLLKVAFGKTDRTFFFPPAT